MADIQLRFHKDMLTFSAPTENVLRRQGVDIGRDMEFMNLIEPDTLHDAMRMELMAGAQCLVANTAYMTPARLAFKRMEDRGEELAAAALAVVNSLKPQHAIVELAPTLLPFDPSMISSLKEHKDQYACAARWFEAGTFDAYYLNGFTRIEEIKCALMGLRQVSDRPVFVSLEVDADGKDSRHESFTDALAVMEEYGASAAGIRTTAPLDSVCALVRRSIEASALPVLVELLVEPAPNQRFARTGTNPYNCPDVLADAAIALHRAGAQFLRAGGMATSAYTGALAITTSGVDVLRPDIEL